MLENYRMSFSIFLDLFISIFKQNYIIKLKRCNNDVTTATDSTIN